MTSIQPLIENSYGIMKQKLIQLISNHTTVYTTVFKFMSLLLQTNNGPILHIHFGHTVLLTHKIKVCDTRQPH